ncbi:MAG: flagellin [bacterium]
MSVSRIYQNPLAINANRNLKITGMNISKSLERLSSGLRINRAADDAAGLSISEKLRSQIRGLNRASTNALDGISLIQTAEGALNETHSILQRMRELSVQAANGIYTAGDRQAIQQEVGQLIDEINRISDTTEFNTKTLLDGTLGALISTDDFTKVRAAVVGNVGNGGNFVLRAAALDTGQLQVQKTDVFSTVQQADAVGRINYAKTYRADVDIATSSVSGVGQTGIYQVEVINDANGSTAVQSTVDATFRISGASLSGGGLSVGRNLQAEELTVGDKILLTVNTQSGVQTVSIVLGSLGTDMDSLAGLMSTALNNGIANVSNVTFTANGTFSINVSNGGSSLSIISTQFVDVDGSGSDFYISFDAGGTSNAFYSAVQYSFFNNGSATSGSLARTTTSGQYFSIGDANTGAVGIRFDVRHDFSQVSLAGATQTDTLEWSRYGGGNSVQEYGKVWQEGPAVTNGTFIVSAISERTYAIFEFDNESYTSLVAGGVDQDVALLTARGARMSNINGDQTFSVAVAFEGAVGTNLENIHFAVDGILQSGETATFNVSTNNVLTADQLNTLSSLNRFQEFGVFNGRDSVELTLYLRGSSNTTTVNLTKNDTFEDMAGKISLAMYNPDGSGIITSGIINPQQIPDLVHVNTVGMAKGTMSITTAVPGAEIVFAGDESILKALSLIEIQEGEAPVYSINAFNIEKNQEVGSVIVNSNEINGLLPGVKVFFDNTLGLKLDPQPPIAANGGGTNNLTSFGYLQPTERPSISLSGNVESFFIHVAPRDFTLQIGANQGQTIDTFLSDMSAEALGVEGLVVVTSDLAQESISIVDHAISKVSSERSRLGAIQNRLESTIRNLDVSAENLTSSESRIRDVDVALETIASTRNQILLQAGVAAMAQANQLPNQMLQLLR